jgi:predicted PurR-regulated permease PerM
LGYGGTKEGFMLRNDQKVHNTARILLLLILGIPCAVIFMPFLMPILLAMFFAFGSEPLMRKFKSRKRRRGFFTAGIFGVLVFLFVVPVILVILRVIEGLKSVTAESLQNSQVFQAVMELWEKVHAAIANVATSVGLQQDLFPQKNELFAKISPFVVEKTTLFLSSLPDLGLSLFVFFCMLFVFIIHAKGIKESIAASNILPTDELEEVIQAFQANCYMILISTILIGMLQAIIVAVGSLIFGFHEFLLIFAVTFFVSFIPVIGAAPVSFLLAIISFLMGNTGSGIGLLVVTVIAGTIDNILKPLVFSKEEENLHPVLSLLGLIGAIIVFGLPGLLFGPLLLQVTVKLTPLFTRKLFSAP